MDTTKQLPTSISIGPGIRGIERGVERVIGGIRELAFVEIEAFIIENLVCQMEQGLLAPAPIWTNAKTFPSVSHIFRGYVDFLFAGYPCQPFSAAGRRKGVEDPRHLYPFIERTIDIIKPRAVFFENVRGHVTLGLREVIGSLESMGYRVHWGIFSAEETGATHKRERVFILGILENPNSQSARNHERGIHGETSSASIELANTRHIRQGRKQHQSEEQQKECAEELFRSNQLADAYLQRFRKEGQYKNWTDINYQQLGNSTCINAQGRKQGYRQNEIGGTVARPGQSQFEWESPRTVITEQAARLLSGYCKKYPESFLKWQIDQVAFDEFTSSVKSSLGCTIDGYNFREDFLRALGNSVYQDTAELAFKTLLHKHGIKINYLLVE